ncbi:hypothetical protein CKO09_00015 [Chromatium weissei]|nr:hypothetical protein [Chromatium weissei]
MMRLKKVVSDQWSVISNQRLSLITHNSINRLYFQLRDFAFAMLVEAISRIVMIRVNLIA